MVGEYGDEALGNRAVQHVSTRLASCTYVPMMLQSGNAKDIQYCQATFSTLFFAEQEKGVTSSSVISQTYRTLSLLSWLAFFGVFVKRRDTTSSARHLCNMKQGKLDNRLDPLFESGCVLPYRKFSKHQLTPGSLFLVYKPRLWLFRCSFVFVRTSIYIYPLLFFTGVLERVCGINKPRTWLS